jgi:hypothetical protein
MLSNLISLGKLGGFQSINKLQALVTMLPGMMFKNIVTLTIQGQEPFGSRTLLHFADM